jgi:hypothetical protein
VSKVYFCALSILLCVGTASANPSTCGKIERGNDGVHDGQPYPTFTYTTNAASAIIIKQDMRVNADGARTAYEVNDHGSSYLCDGLTARHQGKWITRRPCGALVSEAIELATIENDELHFAAAGPQLCIFGFHVEGGQANVPGCSHVAVGGGHAGAKAPLMSIQASDTTLQYLVSSTSLRNRNVDVTERYIDSEQIPFIVVPGRWQYGQVSLRDYAYVYSPTKLNIEQEALNVPRGSFAIVADTGPRGKFGEGSIALHQMLVFGKLRAPPTYQKVATGARHPEQAQIFHPYQDRGDGDIRAKSNIDSTLWYILFPGSGNREIDKHTFEVNSDSSPNGNIQLQGEEAADQLGGTEQIISCLKSSEYFE